MKTSTVKSAFIVLLTVLFLVFSTITAYADTLISFNFSSCSSVKVLIEDLMSTTLNSYAENVTITKLADDYELGTDVRTPRFTSELSFRFSKYIYLQAKDNGKAFNLEFKAPSGQSFFNADSVVNEYFCCSILLRIPYENASTLLANRIVAQFKTSGGKVVGSIGYDYLTMQDLWYTAGGAATVPEEKGVMLNLYFVANEVMDFMNWAVANGDVCNTLNIFIPVNYFQDGCYTIPSQGDYYFYTIQLGDYQCSYRTSQDLTNAYMSDNVILVCNDIQSFQRLYEEYQKDLFYREFFDEYGSFEEFKKVYNEKYKVSYDILGEQGDSPLNGAFIIADKLFYNIDEVQTALNDDENFNNRNAKTYFDFVVTSILDYGFMEIVLITVLLSFGVYVIGKVR